MIIIVTTINFTLLHNSSVTHQALLIRCFARSVLTIRHALGITAFCVTVYTAGLRINIFEVSCNFYGTIPVVESSNGIIQGFFSYCYYWLIAIGCLPYTCTMVHTISCCLFFPFINSFYSIPGVLLLSSNYCNFLVFYIFCILFPYVFV